MIEYKSYEKEVYSWLENKNKQDPNFTFSLRQNGSKGAELDYFIGTEKSRYFAVTFWSIPVGFPGSSGDCIGLVFKLSADYLKFSYDFKLSQTNSPDNEQNSSALNLIKSLTNSLEKNIGNTYVSNSSNKMFTIRTKPKKKEYTNLNEMLKDIDEDLLKIIPLINKQIVIEKKINTLFDANRITKDEFANMNSKLKVRFEKYAELREQVKDEVKQPENLGVVEKKIPKNQILYGPPGTGKTYKTKKLAVEIIENIEYSDSEEDRLLILDKYETYIETENVCFTTFHQSMSYEDFVEGIKPILNEDEEKELSYEIQNGIFKTISIKANKVNNTLKNEIGAILQIEIFDVAWNFLVEEITEKLANSETPSFPTLTNKTLNAVGITDKGNLLLKPSLGSEIEYTVSYNRIKRLFDVFDDLSKIKNIDKEFRAVIGGSNSTAYWSVLNQLYNWINENQDKIESEKQIEESKETYKNHILIIDEINRGNVSAIFGELITLLEEDKRIEQKEMISITLPYSKTKFSVPSNLYVIGTMNTADRSVEALDTALRRRFSFTEVAPDITVLSEEDIEGINLRNLLQTINDRIELLIDKDHKIGHSYFMKIETLDDLKQTFKNKVIPLLEEYFFGDYGKIGLILGNKFIKIKEQETKVSFAKNFTKKYEDADILREKAVYFFTDEDTWTEESFTSIYEQ